MPEAAVGYKNGFNRLPTGEMKRRITQENHNLPKLLDGTPEYSSTNIDPLRGALYKALGAITGHFTSSTVQGNR
jgi:hypothetical protein